MPILQGSKTEKNLLISFAGESQARNRYTYFAGIARKEGFVQISKVFEETAAQEKEHAKRYFKFLETGSDLEIAYPFPAGRLGTTLENLRHAAAGEHHEYTEMYPGFALVAKEEGFPEIAAAFTAIGKVEAWHERRYTGLADLVEKMEVFRKPGKVVWQCSNCGYQHEAMEAPGVCPACVHPQAFFEPYCQPW